MTESISRAPKHQEDDTTPKKQIFLNAFDLFAPSHLSFGQWRNPKDKSRTKAKDLDYWTNLAKILERGDITALFLADSFGHYDIYKGNGETAIRTGSQFPKGDPVIPISAMAAVTKNLCFAITSSTSYEEPYALAKRFSTLDHLTKGRFGWNIVTSYKESGAKAIGREIVEHDKRYDIADEFLRVVYKLWEGSWADDALVLDEENDTYNNYDRIRFIHHQSEHYRVDGPHSLSPSPQRTPFLFQAGTSQAGIAFGATHAEGIFVAAISPYVLAPRVKAIRDAAKAIGRDPKSVKIVAVITPILGRTHEEALAKYQEAEKYASTEAGLAFWSGGAGIDISKFDPDKAIEASDATIDHRVHSLANSLSYRGDDAPPPTPRNIAKYIAIGANGATPVGTAAEVADVIEHWIDVADLDGFNIGYVTTPGSFEDVVDLLVPELRRRGRYAPKLQDNESIESSSSETLTLRERVYGKGQTKLRADHVGYTYRYENSERYADEDKLPKE